jgi:hypothetical protein
MEEEKKKTKSRANYLDFIASSAQVPSTQNLAPSFPNLDTLEPLFTPNVHEKTDHPWSLVTRPARRSLTHNGHPYDFDARQAVPGIFVVGRFSIALLSSVINTQCLHIFTT